MKIQSTIAGFTGAPTTLLGKLDTNTGVLVVVKEVAYREERIDPEFALVSNLDLPALDLRFGDENIRDAIRGYFTRAAQETIDLVAAVARHAPDHRIERDQVDEKGRRYRLAPDITNGQVAVLACVALIEQQSGFRAAVEMASELAEFYRAETI